jgi:superfamily II DNA/RNA helicase
MSAKPTGTTTFKSNDNVKSKGDYKPKPKFTSIQLGLINYAIKCELREVNRLFDETKTDPSLDNIVKVAAVLNASLLEDIQPELKSHVSNNEADTMKRTALKAIKRVLSRTHSMSNDDMNNLLSIETEKYPKLPLSEEYSQIQIVTTAANHNTKLKKDIMKRYHDEQAYTQHARQLQELFNESSQVDKTMQLQEQILAQQRKFQDLIALGKKKQVLMKGFFHEVSVGGGGNENVKVQGGPIIGPIKPVCAANSDNLIDEPLIQSKEPKNEDKQEVKKDKKEDKRDKEDERDDKKDKKDKKDKQDDKKEEKVIKDKLPATPEPPPSSQPAFIKAPIVAVKLTAAEQAQISKKKLKKILIKDQWDTSSDDSSSDGDSDNHSDESSNDEKGLKKKTTTQVNERDTKKVAMCESSSSSSDSDNDSNTMSDKVDQNPSAKKQTQTNIDPIEESRSDQEDVPFTQPTPTTPSQTTSTTTTTTISRELPPWLQRPIYLEPNLSISLSYLEKNSHSNFKVGKNTPFSITSQSDILSQQLHQRDITKQSPYKLQPFNLHKSLLYSLSKLKISALLPAQIALLSHLSTPFQPLNNPQLTSLPCFQSGINDGNNSVSKNDHFLSQPVKNTDICVCSPTGTGKTLAYLLPTINNLLRSSTFAPKQRTMSTLIIVPTQPLAQQVCTVSSQLLLNINSYLSSSQNNNSDDIDEYHYPLKVCLASAQTTSKTSNKNSLHQPILPNNLIQALNSAEKLTQQPDDVFVNINPLVNDFSEADIVIITPGRAIELLSTSHTFQSHLPSLQYLIFDECDSILNSPSSLWLVHLINAIQSEAKVRQRVTKMLFSATFTGSPPHMALLGLQNPIYFTFRPQSVVATIQINPKSAELNLLKMQTGVEQAKSTRDDINADGETDSGDTNDGDSAKKSNAVKVDNIQINAPDSAPDNTNKPDHSIKVDPRTIERQLIVQNHEPEIEQKIRKDKKGGSIDDQNGSPQYILPSSLQLESIGTTTMEKPSILFLLIQYAKALHQQLSRTMKVLDSLPTNDINPDQSNFAQKTTVPPSCGILVFVSSLDTVHRLKRALELFSLGNLKVGELSSNYTPQERNKIISEFQNGSKFDPSDTSGIYNIYEKQYDVLICSDLASRGLDLKSTFMVVNYDFPQNTASFCHRVGRCARSSNYGLAVSLLLAQQTKYYQNILKDVRATMYKPLPRAIFSPSIHHPMDVHLQSTHFNLKLMKRAIAGNCYEPQYPQFSIDLFPNMVKYYHDKKPFANQACLQSLVAFEQVIDNIPTHIAYFSQYQQLAPLFFYQPQTATLISSKIINYDNNSQIAIPLADFQPILYKVSMKSRFDTVISTILPLLMSWEQENPSLPSSFSSPIVAKKHLSVLLKLAEPYLDEDNAEGEFVEVFKGLAGVFNNILAMEGLASEVQKPPPMEEYKATFLAASQEKMQNKLQKLQQQKIAQEKIVGEIKMPKPAVNTKIMKDSSSSSSSSSNSSSSSSNSSSSSSSSSSSDDDSVKKRKIGNRLQNQPENKPQTKSESKPESKLESKTEKASLKIHINKMASSSSSNSSTSDSSSSSSSDSDDDGDNQRVPVYENKIQKAEIKKIANNSTNNQSIQKQTQKPTQPKRNLRARWESSNSSSSTDSSSMSDDANPFGVRVPRTESKPVRTGNNYDCIEQSSSKRDTHSLYTIPSPPKPPKLPNKSSSSNSSSDDSSKKLSSTGKQTQAEAFMADQNHLSNKQKKSISTDSLKDAIKLFDDPEYVRNLSKNKADSTRYNDNDRLARATAIKRKSTVLNDETNEILFMAKKQKINKKNDSSSDDDIAALMARSSKKTGNFGSAQAYLSKRC